MGVQINPNKNQCSSNRPISHPTQKFHRTGGSGIRIVEEKNLEFGFCLEKILEFGFCLETILEFGKNLEFGFYSEKNLENIGFYSEA